MRWRCWRALALVIAVTVAPVSAARPAAAPVENEKPRCGEAEATIVSDHQSIRGTPHDDVIVGSGTGQRIWGLGGDDRICVHDGVRIQAGSGNDVVAARGEPTHVRGGRGRDRLRAQGRVAGGDGNDTIVCEGGRALGGRGRDYVIFAALCTVVEGPGNDLDEGFDDGYGTHWRVSFLHAPGKIRADLQLGASFGFGHDVFRGVTDVHGSPYDDDLRGNAGANRLMGGPGDDVLSGRAGDDRLVGGLGADRVEGGDGADVVAGLGHYWEDVDGPNHLFGGPGPDYLIGGAGDDRVEGGYDVDTVRYVGVPVRVNLAAGRSSGWGHDRLSGVESVVGDVWEDVLIGDGGDNVLVAAAGLGGDTVDGRGGDDVVIVGGGDNSIDGGPGADYVSYDRWGPVVVDLQTGVADGPDHDELRDIENVIGSRGDDVISGDGRENVLLANRGDDRVHGLAGDDILDGGKGFDSLDGGEGVDSCSRGEVLLFCESVGEPAPTPTGSPPTFVRLRTVSVLRASKVGYLVSPRPFRPGYSRPPNGKRADRRQASSFAKRSR